MVAGGSIKFPRPGVEEEIAYFYITEEGPIAAMLTESHEYSGAFRISPALTFAFAGYQLGWGMESLKLEGFSISGAFLVGETHKKPFYMPRPVEADYAAWFSVPDKIVPLIKRIIKPGLKETYTPVREPASVVVLARVYPTLRGYMSAVLMKCPLDNETAIAFYSEEASLSVCFKSHLVYARAGEKPLLVGEETLPSPYISTAKWYTEELDFLQFWDNLPKRAMRMLEPYIERSTK